MRPLLKKILFVLIAILVVGFLLFLFFKKGGGDDITIPTNDPLPTGSGLPITYPSSTAGGGSPTTAGGTTTTVTTPSSKTASLEILSDVPVFDYWVNPSTKEVFYLAEDGVVFQALGGEDRALSLQTFANLRSLEPSPDRQRALVSFGDSANLRWGVFDAIDRSWRPVPEGFEEATWRADSEKIIGFVAYESGGRALGVFDLTKPTQGLTKVSSVLGFRDTSLFAKSSNELLIVERPSTSYPSRVWLLNTDTNTANLLIQQTRGLLAAPSTDRTALFVFTPPSSFRILDWRLSDIAIPFFVSMPEKCGVFASTTLCFVPDKNVTEAYRYGIEYSNDKLYRVSHGGGDSELLLTSGNNGLPYFDGLHPSLVGNDVFFLERRTGMLWVAHLPNN